MKQSLKKFPQQLIEVVGETFAVEPPNKISLCIDIHVIALVYPALAHYDFIARRLFVPLGIAEKLVE